MSKFLRFRRSVSALKEISTVVLIVFRLGKYFIDLRDVATAELLGAAKTVLTANPPALTTPLTRDFLYFIDFLRPMAFHPDSKAALDALRWWEDLGTVVGVTEADLRAAERARRMRNRDVVGCSWRRCVRYGRECDTHVFLECAKCQKAMYCGTLCQALSVILSYKAFVTPLTTDSYSGYGQRLDRRWSQDSLRPGGVEKVPLKLKDDDDRRRSKHGRAFPPLSWPLMYRTPHRGKQVV